ncbi:MAG: methyltransferase domain-containing protein [Magnetococcus sp. WYHC-3]
MFSDADYNVSQAKIGVGMTVADIGAGIGAYAKAASKAVGVGGKVYAVEVQKDLLGRLKSDCLKEGIRNVDFIWGDAEVIGGSQLRDETADRVIVSNVLFVVEDKASLVKEVKRILKPHGMALIVDWSESFGGIGPHRDHVVPREKAYQLFQDDGFEFVNDINAGSHHYGFLMKKNDII